MTANDSAGSLFIRQDTILPGGLIIETETFLPGWRVVRDCDGFRLGRKIEQADWNFFYLAGELKAIVLGRQGPATFRRALSSILAKTASRKFNSLEIREISQEWFLGIPFVIVTANFRHIQQGLTLDPGNNATLKKRVTPDREFVGNRAATLVSTA
jgi:hypothetical protein